MAEESNEVSNVERWYQRQWRPAMAGLYILLCVLDYAGRPIINYTQTKSFDLRETVSIVQELDPAVQILVLEQSRQPMIPPILTEFVHMAFGAILGVAAFSRGSSKGFGAGSSAAPAGRAPVRREDAADG